MELGPVLRSMRHHRGAFSLLVLEVAFGYVILVHALLSARFYFGMHVQETGIADRDIVLATQRFLHPHDVEVARQQQRADLAALRRLDGVVGVAAVDAPPLADSAVFPVILRDSAGAPLATWPLRASSGVVEALGLRLLAGRAPDDEARAAMAAEGTTPLLVTRTLARQLYGIEAAAVGHDLPSGSWRRARICGVVDDFSYRGTWLPHTGSFVITIGEPFTQQGAYYVLRTAPGRLASVALAAHAQLSGAPDSLLRVEPLRREDARYMRVTRGATILLVWIGFLVVAVALSGSLALASFSVAERTRQIGVRRALGARRSEIISYFLLENLVLTGLGVLLGNALALGLNVVIRLLMTELALTPDLALISTAVLIVTGQLSALVPARRAAAIPPWAATRTL